MSTGVLPAGGALAAAAVVFNALVWGLSWWPLRELQSAGLHPLWSTFIIYVIGVSGALALSRGALATLLATPGLWVLALGSGLTNVGFNWAVTVGDVVRVVLLFYLMPAWSMLLAWPILGERPTRMGLLRLALGLGGMVIVLWPAGGGSGGGVTAPWAGGFSAADLLSLAGGASFGLTTVMLRRMAHAPSAARMLAMFGGGAVLSVLAAGAGMLAGVVPAPPAPSAHWVLLAFGLALAFICGNLTMQYGAARLAAGTTALLLLSEILFASASSVWAGVSQLTANIWVGGAMIVLASVLALPLRGKT